MGMDSRISGNPDSHGVFKKFLLLCRRCNFNNVEIFLYVIRTELAIIFCAGSLSVCPSACLSVSISVSLFLSLTLSVRLSFLSVCLSLYVSLCLSVLSLSVYLSACISLYLCALVNLQVTVKVAIH